MKVFITTALNIDLDSERWECARCSHAIGPARDNYKKGLLVSARTPSDVHAPILDPQRYEFTFAPDPQWCSLLEYCCPACGHLVEVEYVPPGHPPAYDIEWDIDALKAQWATREPTDTPVAGPEFTPPHRHHR